MIRKKSSLMFVLMLLCTQVLIFSHAILVSSQAHIQEEREQIDFD